MTVDAHSLKCHLAADVLRAFGSLRLQVAGSSMLPAVRPGDVLTVRRQESPRVAAGDIVLFARQSRLFAHRVLRHSGAMLITRGDALPAQDPPVSSAELLGVVTSISREGKLLSAEASRFRDRAVAYLLRRSEWSCRLVLRLLRRTLFQPTDQKLPLERTEVMQ